MSWSSADDITMPIHPTHTTILATIMKICIANQAHPRFSWRCALPIISDVVEQHWWHHRWFTLLILLSLPLMKICLASYAYPRFLWRCSSLIMYTLAFYEDVPCLLCTSSLLMHIVYTGWLLLDMTLIRICISKLCSLSWMTIIIQHVKLECFLKKFTLVLTGSTLESYVNKKLFEPVFLMWINQHRPQVSD